MKLKLTNKEYHSRAELSSSDLKAMKNGNTLKVYNRITGEAPKDEPTPAMILGSAVHKLVLEPNEFDDEFAVEPCVDKRTKIGKETIAEFAEKNADKTIISANDYERAKKCTEAILSDETAQRLLQNGEAEQSYLVNLDGVSCKVRPDYFNDRGDIIDIKTTSGGVSAKEFAKEAVNRQYYLQASFYFDALKAVGLAPKRFVFIVVNTTDYSVGIAEILKPDLETGRALYKARLALWKDDVDAIKYHTDAVERREDGTTRKIQRLVMPSYGIYDAEEEINSINAYLDAQLPF